MRTANGMTALCVAQRITTVLFILFIQPVFAFPGMEMGHRLDSLGMPIFVQATKPGRPGNMPQHVEAFFQTHYLTAMRLYRKYGIPPSIKIGQAMLESGYGSSDLAVNGYNYFGVKRKRRSEPSYYYKGSWYRRYETPSQSFEHHSLFLLEKSAIRGLVEAGNANYKDWVLVLKEIHYAEDPLYSVKLTGIIERYQLYEMDEM